MGSYSARLSKLNPCRRFFIWTYVGYSETGRAKI
jgi:hypothetical protein